MSATVVKVQDTDTRIVNSVLWTEENGQELIDSVNTLETESVKSVNNRTVTAGTNNVTVDAVHIFATHEGTNSTVQEALDLTNDRIDNIGAGTVSSVNGQPPNANGNVSVTDVFTFLGKASAFVAGTTFQGTFIQRSPSGGTQPDMYYNATDMSYICTTLGISCCRIIHDFQGYTGTWEAREHFGNFIYYPIIETVNGIYPDGNGDVFIASKKLAPGTDLNTLQKEGMYYSPISADACINVPITQHAFSLLVEKHAGVKQTWTSYAADSYVDIYVRNMYHTGGVDTWSSWQKILLDHNSKVTPRLTNFSEMGFANNYFDNYTTFEQVVYNIIVKANTLYGAYPLNIRQYISTGTWMKVRELFLAHINADPNWKDIPWTGIVMEIETAFPDETGTMNVVVKLYDYTNPNWCMTTGFRPNNNTFTKWMDQSGYCSNVAIPLYSVGSGSPNNQVAINLSESLLNFEKVLIEWSDGSFTPTTVFDLGAHGIRTVYITDLVARNTYNTSNVWVSYQVGISMTINTTGNTISLISPTGKFVTLTYITDDATTDMATLTEEMGIKSVYGVNRLVVPRESFGSLLEEPQIETPNIEPGVDNPDRFNERRH